MNIMNIKEAADLCDLRPGTIELHARRGHIPGAEKVGKAWAFEPDSLLEWNKERLDKNKRGRRASAIVVNRVDPAALERNRKRIEKIRAKGKRPIYLSSDGRRLKKLPRVRRWDWRGSL